MIAYLHGGEGQDHLYQETGPSLVTIPPGQRKRLYASGSKGAT